MGWLDDFVSNPVATVSNTVNREVSNFSNSVNAAVAEAPRGDIGGFVSDAVNASINVVRAPFEAVYYAARGENNLASKSIQRGIGSAINLQGTRESGTIFNNQTIGIRAVQTDTGQAVLRNPGVKQATLGLSEDYAGTYRGARTLQDSAYLSREDQNSALRLGAKSAIVAGTATAVQSWWGGLSPEKQLIYGSAGTGIADSIYKGDTKGAVKGITNLIGAPDISGYIPNPSQPSTEIPSYLPGSSPKSGSPYGSTGTVVKDPWDFSGVSDSGIVNAAQASILPIALGIGVLAFLYFRSSK